jgi:hypothetical protein
MLLSFFAERTCLVITHYTSPQLVYMTESHKLNPHRPNNRMENIILQTSTTVLQCRVKSSCGRVSEASRSDQQTSHSHLLSYSLTLKTADLCPRLGHEVRDEKISFTSGLSAW